MKKISSSQISHIYGSVAFHNLCATSIGFGVGLWALPHAYTILKNAYASSAAYQKGYAQGYQAAPVTTITLEKSFSHGFYTGQDLAEIERRQRLNIQQSYISFSPAEQPMQSG